MDRRCVDRDHAACDALIAALRARNAELGVPTPQACGIDPDRWTRLLPLMAEQALASGSPANNPCVPDRAAILQLYREVWS